MGNLAVRTADVRDQPTEELLVRETIGTLPRNLPMRCVAPPPILGYL